jgi:hypothetical protein
MSNKKRNLVTTEVFIQDNFSNFERAHLLEHIHFLEERMDRAENRIEILGDIFRDLLELDEMEEDEEEEYGGEYEDDEEDDELANFFNTHCVCSWLDDEEGD